MTKSSDTRSRATAPHALNRRHFIAGAGACLSAAGLSARPARAASHPLQVVELFTSQGCSSCPPADAILGQLTKRDDIIALSLPVDYWDYLGWRDSLAAPAHTERQKAYARAREDRSVYTPQMVVNGRVHVPGNRHGEVERALAAGAARRDAEVALAFSDREVQVHVEAAEGANRAAVSKATIWLMGYSAHEEVQIGRGENAGRDIAYHNVVRKMVRLASWKGDTLDFRIPRGDIVSKAVDGCAVIVQADLVAGAGPVLGAALLKAPRSA